MCSGVRNTQALSEKNARHLNKSFKVEPGAGGFRALLQILGRLRQGQFKHKKDLISGWMG